MAAPVLGPGIQAAPVNKPTSGYATLAILAGWMLVTVSFWAMAFYPNAQETPEWITQIRTVCFGVTGNEPLGATAYILLFVAPGSLLTAFLVAYGEDVSRALMQLPKHVFGLVAFSGVALIFVVALGFVVYQITTPQPTFNADNLTTDTSQLPANYVQTSLPLPNFTFVDQYGTRLTLSDLRGKTTILTYVFAHCTAVCPLLLTQVLKAMQKLDAEKVQAVLVTLDPWRDTPSSLPDLAKRWQLPANAHIVSGDPDAITQFLTAVNVPSNRDLKTGDIAHPALVHVLDGEANIAFTFNQPPVGWLVDAVRKLDRAAFVAHN